MARIRSIKPEFWTSEQVMDVSPLARLLFIGMWNFADDYGRMTYSPKRLKAQIFPGDDIDSENIRRMLDELSKRHLIILYDCSSVAYIQITGWRHQRIDRPQDSKIPPPGDQEQLLLPAPVQAALPPPADIDSSNDRRTFAAGREGKGEEKSGVLAIGGDSSAKSENSTNVEQIARLKSIIDKFDEFWKAYPNKVGKQAALKAFKTVAKSKAVTFEKMMEALGAYIKNKPPDRNWCNPTTWLNQGRWDDEVAKPLNSGPTFFRV